MNKLKILLTLFSLLAIGVLFSKCSWLTTEDPIIKLHQSSLPIYNDMQNEQVDRVIRNIEEDKTMDLIYWKDGAVSAFSDHLYISNIILRENYRTYYQLYEPLISRLRYEYKFKDLDYILFNSYIYSIDLPILTKTDYFRMNRDRPLNKGSTILQEKTWVSIMWIVMAVTAFFILISFINNLFKSKK